MSPRPDFGFATCYLDASAISTLSEAKGDEAVALFKAVTGGTALSTLNILELGATERPEVRGRLLRTALWIGGSKVLDEPLALLRKCFTAFRDGSAQIDPFTRKPGILLAVSDPRAIDERLRLDFKTTKDQIDGEWRAMHERMRESTQKNRSGLNEIDSVFAESPDKWLRTSRELLKTSLAETMDDFLAAFGFAELKGRGSDLIEGSEALRFFFGAVVYAIHRHGVMTTNFSVKKDKNPGWIDLQQAIYMSLSRLFVTRDSGQRDALRIIAKCSERQIEVVDYSEFRDVAMESAAERAKP